HLHCGEKWGLMAMSLSGGPAVVDWLLEKADELGKHPEFFDALGMIGDPRAVEVLLDAINAGETETAAARALQRITGSRTPATQRARTPGASTFWPAWWAKHANGFTPGRRYRRGKPVSPAVLVEELSCPSSLCRERWLVYDEMAVRYGIRI